MKSLLSLPCRALAALTVLALAAHAAPAIKIGFLVKQPEEPWFQLEWKFADQAAKDLGFTLDESDRRLGLVSASRRLGHALGPGLAVAAAELSDDDAPSTPAALHLTLRPTRATSPARHLGC
jgi:hypothetical protein